MYKTSSFHHIILLLSLAYASFTIADNEITESHNNQSAETTESKPSQEQAPTDHFKHILTAGLVNACETHAIDELNAHIYSPEQGCTFSSAVNNNSERLIDRVKRIAGIEPTISISSGVVLPREETHPKIRFQRAIIKFAENSDLPCAQTIDSNDNKTVVCTIIMTLKEFMALKEEYKNGNP